MALHAQIHTEIPINQIKRMVHSYWQSACVQVVLPCLIKINFWFSQFLVQKFKIRPQSKNLIAKVIKNNSEKLKRKRQKKKS
jgi:hypothetical protein